MTPVERVGRSAIRGAEDVGTLALQSWQVMLRLPRVGPIIGRRRRWRATVQQMLTIGARALPMAAVMSFCIGYVLALQSAAELRRFGALQFVVNLVAISFTRELGALITALAVSGRTASAIAAEVGTMVVTEEIDALRVTGLDPVEFTLAPKLLGALITVPCLTVLSTFRGDVDAVHEDHAGVWFREPQHLFQQGRLPRSAAAEEHEDLAAVHLEVDLVQHPPLAVARRQTSDRDHRVLRRRGERCHPPALHPIR